MVSVLVASTLTASDLHGQCLDISGEWDAVENGSVTCEVGGEQATDPLAGTGPVVMVQDGCDLHYVIPGTGYRRRGTISGDRVRFSGPLFLEAPPGVTPSVNTFDAGGRASGTRMELTGSGEFRGTTSEGLLFSCSAESHAVFTRDAAPPDLEIVGVAYEHQEFPSAAWIPLPRNPQPITTQGNAIRITAEVRNNAERTLGAEVRFYDRSTERLLPGAPRRLTLAPGETQTTSRLWLEGGSAWTAGGAEKPTTAVEVVVHAGGEVADRSREELKILPKPVILVHGLWSDPGAWARYPGFLLEAHPGWEGRVFAVGDGRFPGMPVTFDTGSPGDVAFPPIAENALALARYIRNVQDATEAWKVDIVAHSMGGLISRFYVQELMLDLGTGASPEPAVENLVMLGTPNLGTPCAALWPGLTELSPAYATGYFNPRIHDHRGVDVSALAGDPCPLTCTLFSQRGDGVVEVASALWNYDSPGISPENHLQLNRSESTFRGFVKPLLDDPPSARAPVLAPLEASAAAEPAAPVFQQAAPSGLAPLLLSRRLKLPPGVSVEVEIPVPRTSDLSLAISTAGSVLTTLRDPARVVLPLACFASSFLRTFRVEDPAPGDWTLTLEQEGEEEASALVGAAVDDNPADLVVHLVPADGGRRIHIEARLTLDGEPLAGAGVRAQLIRLDGSVAELDLSDDGVHGDAEPGDGVYGAVTGELAPGTYEVMVEAREEGLSRAQGGLVELRDTAPCEPGPHTLCLLGGRFKAVVSWLDFQGGSGSGRAEPLTSDTGYFWFFDESNVELVVKVLDGTPVNGRYWVFYGALSNVDYLLRVTDTQTGAERLYWNPARRFASRGDTTAFAALPSAAATGGSGSAADRPPASERPLLRAPSYGAPCSESGAEGEALCLNRERFRIEVSWTDFQGNTGRGRAFELTDDTGYFWFFDRSNVELIVKVLDGRAVNGHFWVFYGALSNVGYTITVTDTRTDTTRVYTNPSGRFRSLGDTEAF